jgi:hypothetical protein
MNLEQEAIRVLVDYKGLLRLPLSLLLVTSSFLSTCIALASSLSFWYFSSSASVSFILLLFSLSSFLAFLSFAFIAALSFIDFA